MEVFFGARLLGSLVLYIPACLIIIMNAYSLIMHELRSSWCLPTFPALSSLFLTCDVLSHRGLHHNPAISGSCESGEVGRPINAASSLSDDYPTTPTNPACMPDQSGLMVRTLVDLGAANVPLPPNSNSENRQLGLTRPFASREKQSTWTRLR